MNKINIIFLIKNGMVDTPFATTNDIIAEAHFDNLAQKLLGDDYEYIVGREIDYSIKLVELNNYLNNMGVSVEWFTDIEVNK